VARYTVTGCAGFVGSHLAEALLRRGDEVLGVDAFTDYYERDVKESNLAELRDTDGFELVEADLAEAPLEPLLDGVEGVFHLAAQPGVRGSWGDTFAIYARDNLVATQRLFEIAARTEKRVVFASSSSVYGNAETYPTTEDMRPQPVSPYGVTKLTCEHLARVYGESFGLDVIALRYFTVYGPRQRPDMAFTRIAQALAAGGSFTVLGSGEQSRDFTYVDDAVAATLLSMERGTAGAVYNVGGGTEATLNEILELGQKLAGRELDLHREPAAAGDVTRTAADTSSIRADTGWEPQIPLEEGFKRHLDWAGAL
jgi:nucleoside-diphosphate-sugar epimerase